MYTHAQTPTMSIEAEAVNGELIPGGPASMITASPGDLIEIIVRLRDWSVTPTTRLKGVQVTVEHAGFHNGVSGVIHPIGLDPDFEVCDVCFFCPSCPFPPPGCETDPNPDALYIDSERDDFPILCGSLFPAIDLLSCDPRFAVAVLQTNCAPISMPDVRVYLGMLNVLVSPDAVGQFTITLKDDPQFGCLLATSSFNPLNRSRMNL
jgi:hypothetical protein